MTGKSSRGRAECEEDRGRSRGKRKRRGREGRGGGGRRGKREGVIEKGARKEYGEEERGIERKRGGRRRGRQGGRGGVQGKMAIKFQNSTMVKTKKIDEFRSLAFILQGVKEGVGRLRDRAMKLLKSTQSACAGVHNHLVNDSWLFCIFFISNNAV